MGKIGVDDSKNIAITHFITFSIFIYFFWRTYVFDQMEGKWWSRFGSCSGSKREMSSNGNQILRRKVDLAHILTRRWRLIKHFHVKPEETKISFTSKTKYEIFLYFHPKYFCEMFKLNTERNRKSVEANSVTFTR